MLTNQALHFCSLNLIIFLSFKVLAHITDKWNKPVKNELTGEHREVVSEPNVERQILYLIRIKNTYQQRIISVVDNALLDGDITNINAATFSVN